MGSSPVVPPPPPGFTLIPEGGSIPPPPPGFTIIGASPAPPPAPPAASPTLAERWAGAAPRREGALKSILNMLAGVYDIGNMGPRDLAPGLFPEPQRNLTDLMLGREAQAPPARLTAREILQADPSNPSAPNITPTPDEMGGYTAANIAAFLAPTPAGKFALPAAALQTGLLTGAQGGTAREVATSAATAGLLPPVINRAAGALARGAVTQYERALGATREGTKAAAARIAPEMIERGVTGSIPKLAAKGAEEANQVGGQIRAAYDAATQQGVMVSTAPALRNLDKLRSRYVTTGQGGAQVVTNPQAVQRIDSVRDMLQQIGPQATPNQLWQVRQNLDEIVGGAFDVPAARQTAKEIAKAARAGLQSELDKADPAIRVLNREFGIWKDLEKVAGATERRRTSQEAPLSMLLSGLAGAGTSFANSGDYSDAALTGLAGAAAMRAAKTPLVRTNLAVGMNQTAGAMEASANPIARLLAALFGQAADSPQ